jgi:hypothetical protein
MITDTEIKLKGFDALIKALGEVTAEKFIALIQKDKFDYTKWQSKMFDDLDLTTLSKKAMEFRKKTG